MTLRQHTKLQWPFTIYFYSLIKYSSSKQLRLLVLMKKSVVKKELLICNSRYLIQASPPEWRDVSWTERSISHCDVIQCHWYIYIYIYIKSRSIYNLESGYYIRVIINKSWTPADNQNSFGRCWDLVITKPPCKFEYSSISVKGVIGFYSRKLVWKTCASGN